MFGIAARPSESSPIDAQLGLEHGGRAHGDRVFAGLTLLLGGVVVLLGLALLITMVREGGAALLRFGPAFLWTTTWNPVT